MVAGARAGRWPDEASGACRSSGTATAASTRSAAGSRCRSSAASTAVAPRARRTCRATGPVIVITNHKANIDPVIVGMICDRPLRYMAKKELFGTRPCAELIVTLGAFPIDRGAGDRAALRTSLDILAEGGVLLMFPEGTGAATTPCTSSSPASACSPCAAARRWCRWPWTARSACAAAGGQGCPRLRAHGSGRRSTSAT